MTLEIIPRSNSMKVWDQAGIVLVTPGSAIRLTTEGATELGLFVLMLYVPVNNFSDMSEHFLG